MSVAHLSDLGLVKVYLVLPLGLQSLDFRVLLNHFVLHETTVAVKPVVEHALVLFHLFCPQGVEILLEQVVLLYDLLCASVFVLMILVPLTNTTLESIELILSIVVGCLLLLKPLQIFLNKGKRLVLVHYVFFLNHFLDLLALLNVAFNIFVVFLLIQGAHLLAA